MNQRRPVIGICIARTETSDDFNDILYDIINECMNVESMDFCEENVGEMDSGFFENQDGVSYYHTIMQFVKWYSENLSITMHVGSAPDGNPVYSFVHDEFKYDTEIMPYDKDDTYTLSVTDINTVLEMIKAYDSFVFKTMNLTLYDNFNINGRIGLHYL